MALRIQSMSFYVICSNTWKTQFEVTRLNIILTMFTSGFWGGGVIDTSYNVDLGRALLQLMTVKERVLVVYSFKHMLGFAMADVRHNLILTKLI